MKTKKTAPKTPKADTLESLLKQRDEIEAKIRQLTRPYKTGEKVLVVADVIDEDDDESTEVPYELLINGTTFWATLSDIRGKA